MEIDVNSTVVNPAKQYQKLDVQTAVADATPHQLIELMFDGARDRLNQALGYLDRGDVEGRNRSVNSVVDIVSGLQASLDHEEGGEIAANLESLYDYMQRRLYRANTDNDPEALKEVLDLLETLRSAWAEIGQVSAA